MSESASPALETVLKAVTQPRVLVMVEGMSDRVALEALAERSGRDLEAEGVAIVSIGGAAAIEPALRQLEAWGVEVRLAGLCDREAESGYRRSLERAGLGSDLGRADMEQLGFFVCVEDLEDELIRARGTEATEELVAAQGELRAFRSFQGQPQWRGRTREEQLRRFMGTRSGRKARYAQVLVNTMDPQEAPRPLRDLLSVL